MPLDVKAPGFRVAENLFLSEKVNDLMLILYLQIALMELDVILLDKKYIRCLITSFG